MLLCWRIDPQERPSAEFARQRLAHLNGVLSGSSGLLDAVPRPHLSADDLTYEISCASNDVYSTGSCSVVYSGTWNGTRGGVVVGSLILSQHSVLTLTPKVALKVPRKDGGTVSSVRYNIQPCKLINLPLCAEHCLLVRVQNLVIHSRTCQHPSALRFRPGC